MRRHLCLQRLLTVLVLVLAAGRPVLGQDSPAVHISVELDAPSQTTLSAGQTAELDVSLPAGTYRIQLERQATSVGGELSPSELSIVDPGGKVLREGVIRFEDGDKTAGRAFVFALDRLADIHFRLSNHARDTGFTIRIAKQEPVATPSKSTFPGSGSKPPSHGPASHTGQERDQDGAAPAGRQSSASPAKQGTWEELYSNYCAWAKTQGVDLRREESAVMQYVDARKAFAAGQYDEAARLLQGLDFPRGPGYLAGDIARMWQALAEARLQTAIQSIRQDPQLKRLSQTAQQALNKKNYAAASNIYRAINGMTEAAASDAQRQIAASLPVDLADVWRYPRPGQLPNLFAPLTQDAWTDWLNIQASREACDWLPTVQLLSRHVQTFPNTQTAADAWLELVRIGRHHTDRREAESDALQAALKALPDHHETDRLEYQLAQNDLEAGHLLQGAQRLERLYERWPGSDYANYGLLDAALAYISLGGLDQDNENQSLLSRATDLLQIARKENPDPYFHLNVLFALQYTKPGLNYRELLNAQERIIENPLTPLVSRVEARHRVRMLQGIVPPNRDVGKARVTWDVHVYVFKRRGPTPVSIVRQVGAAPPGSDRLTDLNIADIKGLAAHFKDDVWRMSRGSVRINLEITTLDEAMPLVTMPGGMVWADYAALPGLKTEPVPTENRLSIIMMAPMGACHLHMAEPPIPWI